MVGETALRPWAAWGLLAVIVRTLQRETAHHLIHFDGTASFEETGRQVDFLITLGPGRATFSGGPLCNEAVDLIRCLEEILGPTVGGPSYHTVGHFSDGIEGETAFVFAHWQLPPGRAVELAARVEAFLTKKSG